MKVFFYGLFMDENLLAEKGVNASDTCIGYIDGFRLRIGERATLERREGARAYGVAMEVADEDLRQLYAEDSVADYVPETVVVELVDGGAARATCYNLPGDRVAGTNKCYAQSLTELATRLGLPGDYIDQVRAAGD